MEVILKQDVDKIGRAGVVVKVKDGFARNFLIPNKLAIPVNATNIKMLNEEKKNRILQLEKIKKEAEGLMEKLSGLSLTVAVLTQEDEKLYASISAQDIANSLKEEGYNIEKSCVMLEEPIKALGIYEIPIKLHSDILAKIKVWIVKK